LVSGDPSSFWVGAVQDSDAEPAGPDPVPDSLTVIEKAGNADFIFPSVTEIRMSVTVPVHPVGGMPAISPVAGLNVAQGGSFDI